MNTLTLVVFMVWTIMSVLLTAFAVDRLTRRVKALEEDRDEL